MFLKLTYVNKVYHEALEKKNNKVRRPFKQRQYLLNPLNLNVSMYILRTVVHAFSMLMIRRIH